MLLCTRMKLLSLLLLPVAGAALMTVSHAQDDRPKVTAAEALKLGVDKLAEKLGDQSEAGQDSAALFYATAKRLQTENKLAATDLMLVSDLDNLRQVIGDWDDAWCEGMYHVSGGGTMWSHMQSRNNAVLEDLLAVFAAKMPLKEGNAGEAVHTEWNKVKKAIETAKGPEDADPETAKAWKEHKKVMLERWERLHFELQAINDTDAKAVLKHIMPDAEQLAEFSGK